MKTNQAHFVGVICWLPAHKPERQRFQAGEIFVAIARFTSDLAGPVREASINYSPISLSTVGECFDVRLHFRTLEGRRDEIEKLARYTEILIMDGHKVIAVCRNIIIPNSKIYLEDEWQSGGQE